MGGFFSSPSPPPAPPPTPNPTPFPTGFPTLPPSLPPTFLPTAPPTKQPTKLPTISPTRRPTQNPSVAPTTLSPTQPPSLAPTQSPTLLLTSDPTGNPTSKPTTANPTKFPTNAPTTLNPTQVPTKSPTLGPTTTPTQTQTPPPTTTNPTLAPTTAPTLGPTFSPTLSPTFDPTRNPTSSPTSGPTQQPTSRPTEPLTEADVCPIDRLYPPTKYEIQPFKASSTSGVEDDLSEISSLAFTDQTDAEGNLYAYVVSDKNQFSLKLVKFPKPSSTQPNIDVLTGPGTTVATYSLDVNYTNSDWEDISLGPCDGTPSDQYFPPENTSRRPCIYVGNFGNNNRGGGYVQRSVLKIFKFEEPVFNAFSPPADISGIPVTSILFSYAPPFNPDVFYDAEGLFVDWTGGVGGEGKGDIYVVAKGKCGKGIGRIPASYHQTLPLNNVPSNVDVPDGAYVYPMPRVLDDPPKQGQELATGRLIDCSEGPFRTWQGADMKRDGTLMAFITGQSPPRVHFYPRLPGQSVVEALEGPVASEASNCPYIASTSYGLTKNERKHEAVGFTPDGNKFADTSECRGGLECDVPIYFWDLVYPTSPSVTNGDALIPAHDDGLWSTITFDDFESGDHKGNYTNGTRAFPSDAYACPPSSGSQWAMQIFLHDGPQSAIVHTQSYNASAYSWLKVQFDFLLDGFDHLDTLFLELSLDGGDTFYMVADWAKDVRGIGSSRYCYDSLVTTTALQASTFGNRVNFGSTVKLRFRTSANAKNDRIYLDNIYFEGHP